MLISKDQIKRILEIIKKRHNLFAIKTIGAEVLTPEEIKALQAEYGVEEVKQIEDFLKDAYYAGYLRSKDLGTLIPISHLQFKNDPAKTPLEEFESYTLENSKAITESYVRKLSQEAQTNFNQLIQSYNKAYKDFLQTNLGQGIIDVALPMTTIALEENKAVGMLARAMRDQVEDLARNWKRVAITETTNIVNNAMVDKIVKMNPEKSTDDIIVYKRVVNDQSLCRICLKLHVSSDGTPKLYKLSDVLANGNNIGRKANDWQMVTGAVHPHCFDKETEVLSDRGWVLFKDLAGCEKILSVNLDNGQANWTDINAIVAYHYQGEMTHFYNRICDLMVTEEHSHVAKTRKSNKWELVKNNELKKQSNLLATIPNWQGKEVSEVTIGSYVFQIDDYIQFMAMYLSDGSISKNRNRYDLKIAQQDKQHLITPLFKKYFGKVWVSADYVMAPIVDERFAEYLKDLGHSQEKYIPRFIKDLPKEKLKLFLETFVQFDGTIRPPKNFKGGNFKESRYYYTTSNQMASDLGEIILKVGKRPSYRLNPAKENKFKNGIYSCKPCWVISELNTVSLCTHANMAPIKIDYDDMVYDVELVKDHTLFVRRNGKVILSGNCRCQLSQLPSGWYFSKDGPLEFVGEKEANQKIADNLGEE